MLLRIVLSALLICTDCVSVTVSYARDAINPGFGLPPIPVPVDNPQTPARIALGRRLFFDGRLSQDGSISCSSCHQPERAFSDGRSLALGIGKRQGARNAPTLVNVAFNSSQFWDGRARFLEEQALSPFTNPLEHGLKSYNALLELVRADSVYVASFRAAFFVDAISIRKEHIGKAIACFERTLIAGDSQFDRHYFGSDQRALSQSAQRGLVLFQGAAACSSCHLIGPQSALFTDNQFHSVSVGLRRIASRLPELTRKLVLARQSGTTVDQAILADRDLAELGHFAVTLNPIDIGTFRTPSLRNVALTAPYMHDGSVPTLEDAVERELYLRGDRVGHPLILTPSERADLVEFLKALTSLDVPAFRSQR